MAESTIVKTRRDCTLVLYDDARTNSYTIAYEQGDFSLTIPGRTVNVFLDRGALGATPSVRWGDDQPMSGSVSMYFRDANDAAVATIFNIATNTGWAGSNWVSTLGSTAEQFCVELVLTIEGSDHGDGSDHTITIDHCHLQVAFTEGDPSTLAITFTSFALYPTLS